MELITLANGFTAALPYASIRIINGVVGLVPPGATPELTFPDGTIAVPAMPTPNLPRFFPQSASTNLLVGLGVDPLQANCIAPVPLPPVKEQVSNITVEPVKNPIVDKKENKKDDNKNEEREMQKDIEDPDVDVDEF